MWPKGVCPDADRQKTNEQKKTDSRSSPNVIGELIEEVHYKQLLLSLMLVFGSITKFAFLLYTLLEFFCLYNDATSYFHLLSRHSRTVNFGGHMS